MVNGLNGDKGLKRKPVSAAVSTAVLNITGQKKEEGMTH